MLVTPELVAPLNPQQVAYVPGTDHVAPNDWELFALGQLSGQGRPDKGKAAPARTNWPARTAELYDEPAALHLRGPIGPASGDEGT